MILCWVIYISVFIFRWGASVTFRITLVAELGIVMVGQENKHMANLSFVLNFLRRSQETGLSQFMFISGLWDWR